VGRIVSACLYGLHLVFIAHFSFCFFVLAGRFDVWGSSLVLLLVFFYLVLFFFFFQAEDGIRDATVTGVQTCALPISARARSRAPPPRAPARPPYTRPSRGSRARSSGGRRAGPAARTRGRAGARGRAEFP